MATGMPGSNDFELLDNPIWHALGTRHAEFAQGDGLARRYAPEVTSLAGMPDQSEESLAALRRVLGPQGAAALFLDEEPRLPASWNLLNPGTLTQMVCRGPVRAINPEGIEPLDAADVDEMIALTSLTKPGPFGRRTIELAGYCGIRQDGRLAAMAGQRMQVGNCTEVSAVCTHPDFRGRGHAAKLVSAVAAAIQARGEVPFLHVLTANAAAISVYQKLGFEIRRAFHLRVVLPEGEGVFL